MKRFMPLAAVLLAVPSGPEVARDELIFAPKEGVRLKKTFQMISELKLVNHETKTIRDGVERDSRSGEFDISISEEQTIIFSDVYHSMEDGRATRINRTFEALSRQWRQEFSGRRVDPLPVLREEREGTSELEDLTVIFTWAEDEEKYAVEFAEKDEDEDEDLLEELNAHADLAWFLPESEVAEGDSWDLEVGAFPALTSPGGDTKIERANEEFRPESPLWVSIPGFDELFAENLEGNVTCTYEGAEDGIATVAIEMELESRFERELEPIRVLDREVAKSTSYSSSLALEGELRWNVEAGHASTLLLEGDGKLEYEEARDRSFLYETRTTQNFEGRLRIKVTIE